MALTKGGGDRGGYLEVSCIPDSTFKTEIDALIAAGTQVTGKLCSLTFGANYEVTSPADGAIPDGKIVHYEQTSSSYRLTVRFFSYIDQNSVRHTPVCIMTIGYSGTLALQDSMIVNGTTYLEVDDGGAGGWGAAISLDTTNSRADFIC